MRKGTRTLCLKAPSLAAFDLAPRPHLRPLPLTFPHDLTSGPFSLMTQKRSCIAQARSKVVVAAIEGAEEDKEEAIVGPHEDKEEEEEEPLLLLGVPEREGGGG